MFGKEIKQYRKSLHITQVELSKATKIPQATISWIESDEGIPNVYQCLIIAKYFGTSIEELIGENTTLSKAV